MLGVASTTIQAAYANAFSLLFLVTLAFGLPSCIAAYYSPVIERMYRRMSSVGSTVADKVSTVRGPKQRRKTRSKGRSMSS